MVTRQSELPQYNPLVRPQTSFDSLRLPDSQLALEQRLTVPEPQERFCLDRFRLMTHRQQAELLADIAMHTQGALGVNCQVPFILSSMYAHLNVPRGETVSRDAAIVYYLDYPSKGAYLWLQEAMREPELREVVLERIFDNLRRELPAIAYTLAHLYEGGYYGLLTARGGRDIQHACQIEAISELFGFAPQTELVYYVNDPILGKRLGGRNVSSAAKKATVLINFANGLKEDEQGYVERMKLGRPFKEIIFIDDEDKNLEAVMNCLIRGVCDSVMHGIGMRFNTPWAEESLNKRAAEWTREYYEQGGVEITSSMKFWVSLVDRLLVKYAPNPNEREDSEALISRLIAEDKWMPDVIKVLDGRKIPIEPSLDTLRSIFARREPILMGTKPSIVFNDIDRNILSVNAVFDIFKRGHAAEGPVFTFNQVDFAQHPTVDYWLDKVSSEKGIPRHELYFSWAHFDDPDVIRRDILEALHKGRIAANPHLSA